MRTLKLSIPDMHCAMCVIRLEGLEDDLIGVIRADASYQKQQMIVQYDDDKVTIEQIEAEITKMGYHVAKKE